MKKISLILVIGSIGLMLFGSLSGLLAENYYVDALNGADTNAGTSPETAWKTLRNVNRQQFLPGDTIALRAGQVWRETIRCSVDGEPGKPITYTSYGKGPKPALWGSVDLAHEDCWQQDAPGIWVTRPDDVKILDSFADFWRGNWSKHSEGKARVTWKVSKDAQNRSVYSIECAENSDRGCDIQLNYASFPLPAEQAFSFRFLVRIEKDGKNLLKDAEMLKKFLSSSALMMAGHPWSRYGGLAKSTVTDAPEGWSEMDLVFRVENLEPKKDGRLSFFVGEFLPAGSTLSLIPLDARFAEVRSIGLSREIGNIIMTKKDADPAAEKLAAWKRWKVEDLKDPGDYYYDIPTARLYFRSDANPGSIYSMMEAAGKCNLFNLSAAKHIQVDGLSFAYSGGHGLRGGPNCQHCVVRGNDFLWIGGSWLYTRGPIPTRYGNGIEFWSQNEDLLIEKNYFYQIYDTAMTNQGPDAGVLKEMVWRENRCEKCEQCYEIWLTSPEMTVESLTVADSTFLDSGYGWSHAQRPDKRATHFLAYGMNAKIQKIDYHGNYLGRTLDKMLWFHHSRAAEFKLNHNEYVQPGLTSSELSALPLFYWGGQPKEGVTFEKYRELTGNDEDSTLRNE